MGRIRTIAVVMLLILLLPGAAAAEGGSGLSGRVQNGTAGGGSTAGLQVTAWGMEDGKQAREYAAVTDAQGVFRFDDLAIAAEADLVVRTEYQGVTYSTWLRQEPGQPTEDVTLSVYESTTTDSDIAVERGHLLISPLGDAISVVEMYILTNAGDRTYVGREELAGRRWTTQFTLPTSGYDLALSDGELGGRFLATEAGFVDREPLWPGRTSVMFRYTLACPGGECALARPLAYATGTMNVLLPDDGARVLSPQLTLQGSTTAEEQGYLNYVASGLSAGQTLELRIVRDAPVGPVTASGGAWALPWYVLGVAGVAAAVGYPFWRRRRSPQFLGDAADPLASNETQMRETP